MYQTRIFFKTYMDVLPHNVQYVLPILIDFLKALGGSRMLVNYVMTRNYMCQLGLYNIVCPHRGMVINPSARINIPIMEAPIWDGHQ